jgi:hypothetical protein
MILTALRQMMQKHMYLGVYILSQATLFLPLHLSIQEQYKQIAQQANERLMKHKELFHLHQQLTEQIVGESQVKIQDKDIKRQSWLLIADTILSKTLHSS